MLRPELGSLGGLLAVSSVFSWFGLMYFGIPVVVLFAAAVALSTRTCRVFWLLVSGSVSSIAVLFLLAAFCERLSVRIPDDHLAVVVNAAVCLGAVLGVVCCRVAHELERAGVRGHNAGDSCSDPISSTQSMTAPKDSKTTKVVVEIPDALNPDAADQKYTQPLRQLLADERVGWIASVKQGPPETPGEFSRIITVQLTDYDDGLNLIQRFLVERDAPPGTMMVSYDAEGNTRDIFGLAPSEHDE